VTGYSLISIPPFSSSICYVAILDLLRNSQTQTPNTVNIPLLVFTWLAMKVLSWLTEFKYLKVGTFETSNADCKRSWFALAL
jgi:hypothetical protein